MEQLKKNPFKLLTCLHFLHVKFSSFNGRDETFAFEELAEATTAKAATFTPEEEDVTVDDELVLDESAAACLGPRASGIVAAAVPVAPMRIFKGGTKGPPTMSPLFLFTIFLEPKNRGLFEKKEFNFFQSYCDTYVSDQISLVTSDLTPR